MPDKLETLIKCIPESQFKQHLTEEITKLRAEIERATFVLLAVEEAIRNDNCPMGIEDAFNTVGYLEMKEAK